MSSTLVIGLFVVFAMFGISFWNVVNALIAYGQVRNFERACAFAIALAFLVFWTSVLLYVF